MSEDRHASGSDSEKTAVSSVIPEEVSEILDTLEPDQRKQVERLFVSQFSMISRVSPELEVTKKITGDHISTMLNTQDKAMEHSFTESRQKRQTAIINLVIVSLLLIAVIFLLRDQSAVMEKIISAIIGGLGGFGIGMYKSHKDN